MANRSLITDTFESFLSEIATSPHSESIRNWITEHALPHAACSHRDVENLKMSIKTALYNPLLCIRITSVLDLTNLLGKHLRESAGGGGRGGDKGTGAGGGGAPRGGRRSGIAPDK